MTHKLSISRSALFFLLFLLALFTVVGISRSGWMEQQPASLAIGLTLDLVITLPLLYALAIWKTRIPRITVVPVLFLGTVFATWLVPAEHQSLLQIIKTWGLPVVELGVLTFLGVKVFQLNREFKRRQIPGQDFYATLQSAALEVLPKVVARVLTTEIAVFFYGFLLWKKPVLKPGQFTYHRKSGTPALLGAIIFIVLVETAVLHLVLSRWSETAAWILSILSIYTGLQLFAFLRSLNKRPFQLSDGQLFVRYGIFGEMTVALRDIERIERSRKSLDGGNRIRKLSPLGELDTHNMILHFHTEQTLNGFYGLKKTCTGLALFVDDPEAFEEAIFAEKRMG